MSAPFRAQSYNRVVLLQTAAEWAETTDKVLQDYETGRESDTGLEKTGDGTSEWADLGYDNPNEGQGIKVYAATISLTDENPEPTILVNTLGGVPVWTYSGTGQYLATLSGAFTSARTLVFWTPGVFAAPTTGGVIAQTTCGPNTVLIETFDLTGSAADALSADGSLRIEVHP